MRGCTVFRGGGSVGVLGGETTARCGINRLQAGGKGRNYVNVCYSGI